MDAKEKQLVAMGARLVTPGSVAKTVTEAQGDSEVEHSVLSLAVANVSEAYTKVLGWMARFNNTAAEKIDYSINQEFTEARLDANLLLAVVQLWQSGKWPEGDLFSFLRRYGLVDPEKTDEEIRDEIETNGSGLGFE